RSIVPDFGISATAGNGPGPDGMVSEPANLIPAALFSNETSSSVYGNGWIGSCRPASTFWEFNVYTYVWIICPRTPPPPPWCNRIMPACRRGSNQNVASNPG